MKRDLMNEIHPVPVLQPKAAVTDNTAYVGAIVDITGYSSLTYLIHSGTNTDTNATFTVLLEEGDDSGLSDAAAVADADLIGTEALASFTFVDDNECFKLGYKGSKRYTRLTVTPAGNDAGNHFVSAMALLGHPNRSPTANPPA